MSTDAFTPFCGPRPARPLLVLPRADVSHFIQACFTDARGVPVVQAAVHDRLQAFLGIHPKALVELPRDHGKSFQVCCRKGSL